MCHKECASITRKRGAKSHSSSDMARVVKPTRTAGVEDSLGAVFSYGLCGGYGWGKERERKRPRRSVG